MLTATFCCILLLIMGVPCSGETGKMDCHDAEGNSIPHGSQFIPDRKDPCQTCQCENGFSIMCTAVSCSPPDCAYRVIDGKCCEFVCEGPQPAYPQTPGGNGTGGSQPIHPGGSGMTNLGLRLVASTVTSFLVLALLLFLIHKLRQRRLLMSIRRLNSSRRRLEEADLERYIAETPPLGVSVPPYVDPPPPYSPPKPPAHHGEPPPPYEAINNNNNINAAANASAANYDGFEQPPAYDRGLSNSWQPNVNGASPNQTISETSFTSQPDSLRSLSQSARRSTDNSALSTSSRNVLSSNEDTRVKEVFDSTSRPAHDTTTTLPASLQESRTPRVESLCSLDHSLSPQTNDVRPASNAMSVFGPRCVKKSGSVEILRQSASPRNSYGDGPSAAEIMSQSLDPSVLNRMLNGMNGFAAESVRNQTDSSSLSQGDDLTSDPNHSTSTPPDHTSAPSVAPKRMDISERRKQFRLSSLLHSPVESFDSSISPMSPVGNSIAARNFRSNSINSDLSWFSVCSETGEPRKSKSVISSESKYQDNDRKNCNKLADVSQLSCPVVPPGNNTFERGDNSQKGDFQGKCSNRTLMPTNYSTERFDRNNLNRIKGESLITRSFSNNDILNANCNHPHMYECPGQCDCKSCRVDLNGTGPWLRQDSGLVSPNRNADQSDSSPWTQTGRIPPPKSASEIRRGLSHPNPIPHSSASSIDSIRSPQSPNKRARKHVTGNQGRQSNLKSNNATKVQGIYDTRSPLCQKQVRNKKSNNQPTGPSLCSDV